MKNEKSPLLHGTLKNTSFISRKKKVNTPVRKTEFSIKYPIYSLIFGLQEPPFPIVSRHEYYHMGPFQRWKLFGKVPWTRIAHITLILLFTLQISSIDWGALVQGKMAESLQRALVAGSSTTFQYSQGLMKAVYFNDEQVLSDLDIILNNYYQLDKAFLGMKASRSYENDPELAPVIEVAYVPSEKVRLVQYISNAANPLGELPVCNNNNNNNNNNNKTEEIVGSVQVKRMKFCQGKDKKEINRDFFMKMEGMSVNFQIFTQVIFSPGIIECYRWTVSLHYAYSFHRAKLRLRSGHVVQYCTGFHRPNGNLVLDSIVVLLCFLIICLSLKTLMLPLKIYNEIIKDDKELGKTKLMGKAKFMLNIPVSSKSRGYHMLTIAACCCTFVFTLLNSDYIPNSLNYGPTTRTWMGFAAFLNYISIPHYIYDVFFRNEFYHIIQTIRIALPEVFRVVLCFVPVMAGYVFVGTMIFGRFSDRFTTLGTSLITLFSVANGDEIRATIKSLEKENPALATFGAFYIVTFICVMMYGVLALIISIMEKTYADVCFKKKNEQSSLEMEDKAEQAIERYRRSSSGKSDK